jgi:hypothetical protein
LILVVHSFVEDCCEFLQDKFFWEMKLRLRDFSLKVRPRINP